ncbi:flagellar motor protein MotB [Mobilicoccus massiliensis]|uniref:flagellar motor protein MotB n=1 Tax=Mobilicoccus massiliensis TaxID=1522310 RepID=UPI000591081D|nr:flagellar motor protein MotB [Mobilicoccus massiliensis]
MARKKTPEEHEGHANHERWVLSYADILTLLLALFIVMFAISKVDQKKFEEFARGTAEGFGNVAVTGKAGNFEGGDGVLKDQKPAQSEDVPSTRPDDRDSALAQAAIQKEKARVEAASAEKRNLEDIKAKIAADLKKKGLSGAVEMKVDERGLVVNIVTDKVLFDTGKTQLQPAGLKILDAIAPSLKPLPNEIVVEGHTDNVPISGTYRSNWELSTTRATEVLQRLLADGLDPVKVTPTGYGQYRPLATNSTDAGRARNRRVSVVVLPYLPQQQAETGLAAATQNPDNAGAVAPTVAPKAPTIAPSIEAPTPPSP